MTLAKAFQPTEPQDTSIVDAVTNLHDEAGATHFVRSLSDKNVIGLHCVLSGEGGVRAAVQDIAIGVADGRPRLFKAVI